MSTVTNAIIEWASKELDYWERLTLDRILTKGKLTEQDYTEILDYALEEKGLNQKPAQGRPKLTFTPQDQPETTSNKYRIEKIFNLRNINALPPGQEIRFGQQLTLIYGENGAGKTGYVRPLSCAAFARGERKVLPNVTAKDAANLTPQADIEVSRDGVTKIVTWTRGLPRPPELGGHYVFDGTSMHAHLAQANAIHFSPSGLDLLTRLVDETDRVRMMLKSRIEPIENAPNNLAALFQGNSQVTEKITSLGSDTDIEELRSLARLSDEESANVTRLEKEVTELGPSNAPSRLARLRQELADLQRLATAINNGAASTGPAAQARVEQLVNEALSRARESAQFGVERLKSDFFTQIGSAPWREFVGAAKALADEESAAKGHYPKPNDPCLLCRQPLSSEAVNLINRLWEYLQSDAEARLQAARNACSEEIEKLETMNLAYFSSESAVHRLLEKELPTLVPMVEAQLMACEDRRIALIKALQSVGSAVVPPPVDVDMSELIKLTETHKKQISSLEAEDTDKKIRALDASLRELKHRSQLFQYIGQIEQFVANKKWAKRAQVILGRTGKITTKHNDLFKKLVTKRYRDLFQETLDKFNCKLKITIQDRGQKGEWMRQIVLSHASDDYRVEEVLSDGEKMTVAFADFWTEASMDQTNAGIILDDPTIALDKPHKRVLANCLVEEAKTRQIAVFTHDLVFLSFVKEFCEEKDLKPDCHWVKVEGDRPGIVWLNNSPMTEREFRTAQRARDAYAKAKKLPPAEQEQVLQQGFGYLRTSYEVLVIHYVFGGVVQRFEEKIGYNQLRNVRVDEALLNEIADKLEALSRHIDAHSHCDTFAGPKPTPEGLMNEIEAYESIKKKQNALNSAAAGQSA